MSSRGAPRATGLGVDEARERILRDLAPLASERVPLRNALGRVLASAVTSEIGLPLWDNSGMDGYAVRAVDVERASATHAITLPVAATIAAGGVAPRALAPGEAMRIMTGAPVPEGADTIIRTEDTDGGTHVVEIRDARDVRRNVRPAHEDVRVGERLFEPGIVIGPAQLGVLASIGSATVDVYRRPRVAIACSGDELVDVDRFDEVRAGRRIISSNGYTLDAGTRQAGADPLNLGILPDDPVVMREALGQALSCDLLITCGGISVGAFDHTREVLSSMGAALDFWRVRIRPGAPLGFGWLPDPNEPTRHIAWIGLPGNPVSAMVTFELFVRPALRRLGGYRALHRTPVRVRVRERIETAVPLTHYLRAIVSPAADGTLEATLTGPQGSGLLTSMARANALLTVPETRRSVAAGETVDALLLGDEALMDGISMTRDS
jgi:molybdopterin molybdotransferase